MMYDKLHDSSHPNAEHMDRLYRDVDASYENYQNVMVDYQKGVGVTLSDVNRCYEGLEYYYKRYKEVFTGTIENSDSDY